MNQTEDAPANCMHRTTFAGAGSSLSGGALCRPSSAPAQESEQRWGVSDPAVAPHPRPRRQPAGSLTPHTSVSVMCWGARLMIGEIPCEDAAVFPENSGGKRY